MELTFHLALRKSELPRQSLCEAPRKSRQNHLKYQHGDLLVKGLDTEYSGAWQARRVGKGLAWETRGRRNLRIRFPWRGGEQGFPRCNQLILSQKKKKIKTKAYRTLQQATLALCPSQWSSLTNTVFTTEPSYCKRPQNWKPGLQLSNCFNYLNMWETFCLEENCYINSILLFFFLSKFSDLWNFIDDLLFYGFAMVFFINRLSII